MGGRKTTHVLVYIFPIWNWKKEKKKILIGAARWKENSIYNDWDWTMRGHRVKLWRGEKVHCYKNGGNSYVS